MLSVTFGRVQESLPMRGAWIEIVCSCSAPGRRIVAPHAGAWIEMRAGAAALLRPTRVAPHAGGVDRNFRMLPPTTARKGCRSPRGSVDRNFKLANQLVGEYGRSPCGSVDRNAILIVTNTWNIGRSPRGSVDRNAKCRYMDELTSSRRSPHRPPPRPIYVHPPSPLNPIVQNPAPPPSGRRYNIRCA